MKKKTIIISILAVFMLITISFTSVIGLQSTENEMKKDSPLFKLRTKKAIILENKAMTTYDYVGKEKTKITNLATIDYKQREFEKIIDIISRMSDREFGSFVSLVVNKLRERSDIVEEAQIPDVINSLYYLRKNPEMMKQNPAKDMGKDYYPKSLFCVGPLAVLAVIIYIVITSPIWIITLLLDCENLVSVLLGCNDTLAGC